VRDDGSILMKSKLEVGFINFILYICTQKDGFVIFKNNPYETASKDHCVMKPLLFVNKDLRYAGVNQLLILITHLYLIGAGFSEDQRTDSIKTECLNGIGLCL
jgi:hypothetical protein